MDHALAENGLVPFGRSFLHIFLQGGLSREGKPRQRIHDDIDPKHLNDGHGVSTPIKGAIKDTPTAQRFIVS